MVKISTSCPWKCFKGHTEDHSPAGVLLRQLLGGGGPLQFPFAEERAREQANFANTWYWEGGGARGWREQGEEEILIKPPFILRYEIPECLMEGFLALSQSPKEKPTYPNFSSILFHSKQTLHVQRRGTELKVPSSGEITGLEPPAKPLPARNVSPRSKAR